MTTETNDRRRAVSSFKPTLLDLTGLEDGHCDAQRAPRAPGPPWRPRRPLGRAVHGCALTRISVSQGTDSATHLSQATRPAAMRTARATRSRGKGSFRLRMAARAAVRARVAVARAMARGPTSLPPRNSTRTVCVSRTSTRAPTVAPARVEPLADREAKLARALPRAGTFVSRVPPACYFDACPPTSPEEPVVDGPWPIYKADGTLMTDAEVRARPP